MMTSQFGSPINIPMNNIQIGKEKQKQQDTMIRSIFILYIKSYLHFSIISKAHAGARTHKYIYIYKKQSPAAARPRCVTHNHARGQRPWPGPRSIWWPWPPSGDSPALRQEAWPRWPSRRPCEPRRSGSCRAWARSMVQRRTRSGTFASNTYTHRTGRCDHLHRYPSKVCCNLISNS